MSPRIMRYINLVRRFRDQLFPKTYGDNQIEIDKNLLGKVRLNIVGKNNRIYLSNIVCNPHTYIYISIFGNQNQVSLDRVYVGNEMRVIIGQSHPNFGMVRHTSLKIGKGSSIESMRCISFNSNTTCEIGENCMISSDVTLWNTDAHSVLELQTGKVLNWVKGIRIGEHCWLGEKSSVLKNSVIPDDCIIGYNAVVSGHLKKSHAAYAGNPAVLVKEGITWDSNGAKHGYIDNDGGEACSS